MTINTGSELASALQSFRSVSLERTWRQDPLCWETLPLIVCPQRTSRSCAVTVSQVTWSWRDLAKPRLHPTECLHQQAAKQCPFIHLELKVEQSKSKARESFQPLSPLRLQLVLCITNSDKDWDLVKSREKKVQRKGYKYASVSQGWRSRAILSENHFRIKKSGGEGVCECVKLHNGKGTILSFLLDRRKGTH